MFATHNERLPRAYGFPVLQMAGGRLTAKRVLPAPCPAQRLSRVRVAAILDLELDLPLADTPASRFLAWIAAGLIASRCWRWRWHCAADAAAWRIAREPVMVTVALPASAEQPFTDLELGTVTQALRRLPGVARSACWPRRMSAGSAAMARQRGRPLPGCRCRA